MEAPLLSEDLYKHTVVADYVVKRHVKLFRDRFETYADAGVPEDHRTFWLDASARLAPDSRERMRKKKRHLRPPGVGSMTALAALRGKGATLELWTFKLEREQHSSFTFCFSDQAQAYRWYDALLTIISELRAKAGLPPLPSPVPSSRPSITGAEGGEATVGPAAAAAANAAAAAAAARGGARSSEGGAYYSVTSHTTTPSLTMENSAAAMLGGAGGSGDNGGEGSDDEEQFNRLLHQPAGTTRRAHQRWVPYRHSNGLAIYQHRSGNHAGGLPEYMVSAVVRGTPTEVLQVLMDPASATTILGPALEVEVLDSSTPGRQVLRLLIAPEGPNAAWFRPREAVVQRLLKKEEDGVYVVLFSSVEEGADDDGAAGGLGNEGVIEVAEGLGDGVRRSHPIRCRVSGGYTISKLRGSSAASSSETLLTCVLQVEDMGGWLNPAHPLFRGVNWWSGGAYESFLERMLLAVMLVRDVVEKSRFAVKPQMFQLAEPVEGQALDQPPSLRSSTFVMRQAADQLRTSSGTTTAAAAAAASPFAGPAGTPLPGSGSAAASGGGGGALQPYASAKVSRLASHRLGSAALASHALGSASGLLPELTEEEGEVVSGVARWDASFKLPAKFYEEIHTPGREAPFKVRGPTYLSDGLKVSPGQPMFELLGMEVVDTGGSGPLPHVSRFLPSIRRSPKPFLFVYNLMVPGPPTMCCVFVFGADAHPDALGAPPDDPEDSDWEPFDFLMWRFLHGADSERAGLFKMIPRIAEGSWVIKQSVGTTPVIIGRKLATSFHVTRKYIEVAVDVGSSTTAQYVTGMVRGGAKNLVLDLGLVLEGQHTWELPEVLLGAVRVNRLDLAAASKLDDSEEVPILDVAPPAPSAGSAASTTTKAAAGATVSTADSGVSS